MSFKLYYFNLYARAEPIRMILAKAGAQWEEQRVEFSEWPALKATMPNGQLPALQVDNGPLMGESIAIARFVAQQHGFYPEDPLVAARSDEAADAYNDLLGKITSPQFTAEEDKKAAAIKDIMENIAPATLKIWEAQLANGGYIAGDKLTFGDFCVGGIYVNMFTNPACYAADQWKTLIAQYPNF